MHRALGALVSTAMPALAAAHPGHGTIAASSWTHSVLEPVHAIPLAIVAWFAVMVVSLRRRRIES